MGLQLQQRTPAGAGDVPELDSVLDDAPGAERAIVCRRCRLRITSSSQRHEQAGRHRHTCVNPAGIVFRIALYRQAPGCRDEGGWSETYSWFAGCAWQIVSCSRCGVHLGWRFRGEAVFYGLIRDRLDEAPDAS